MSKAAHYTVNIYCLIHVYILVIFHNQIQWLKKIIHSGYVKIAQQFLNLVNIDKNGRHYLEALFPDLTVHQIYLSS